MLAEVSVIDEAGERRVRMGTLAFLGSHKVNGVSALHTELMRRTVFQSLHQLYPGPHRQQDQRHHIPPLAVHRESRVSPPCWEMRSDRRCWMIRWRWSGLCRWPTIRPCMTG